MSGAIDRESLRSKLRAWSQLERRRVAGDDRVVAQPGRHEVRVGGELPRIERLGHDRVQAPADAQQAPARHVLGEQAVARVLAASPRGMGRHELGVGEHRVDREEVPRPQGLADSRSHDYPGCGQRIIAARSLPVCAGIRTWGDYARANRQVPGVAAAAGDRAVSPRAGRTEQGIGSVCGAVPPAAGPRRILRGRDFTPRAR